MKIPNLNSGLDMAEKESANLKIGPRVREYPVYEAEKKRSEGK